MNAAQENTVSDLKNTYNTFTDWNSRVDTDGKVIITAFMPVIQRHVVWIGNRSGSLMCKGRGRVLPF